MVNYPQQGQIWWIKLPGTEHKQPVLIVQRNAFNKSDIETVVCVELSPNWKLGSAPGNVVITQSDSGLPKTCVANIAHLLTIDKSYLSECAGTLPQMILESVLDGIELLLGR